MAEDETDGNVTNDEIERHVSSHNLVGFNSTLLANTLDNEILATIDNGMIDNDTFESLMHDISITKYLALISSYLSISRNDNRNFTSKHDMALRICYSLLKNGANLTTNYKSLGVPRYHDYETYLFVTDMIRKNKKLLIGTTVHIEYIDRESVKDKQLIEAYRMASFVFMAFVRLNVSDSAPTSCYIGRPMFEGSGYYDNLREYKLKEELVPLFKYDLLKTRHYTAGCCSSAFNVGICDAKLAIEKMTKYQIIKFMRGVTANVIRDDDRQFLSAAFNLFTPIYITDENDEINIKDKHE